MRDVDDESLLREALGKKTGRLVVVLDEQDAHAGGSPFARGSLWIVTRTNRAFYLAVSPFMDPSGWPRRIVLRDDTWSARLHAVALALRRIGLGRVWTER